MNPFSKGATQRHSLIAIINIDFAHTKQMLAWLIAFLVTLGCITFYSKLLTTIYRLVGFIH